MKRLVTSLILTVSLLTFSAPLPVSAQAGGVRYLVEDLGALGTTPGLASQATGINASGQVSGYAQTDTDGSDYLPFRWTDGVMTNLGTLGGRSNLNFGPTGGINNSGQATGYTLTAGNALYHAFLSGGPSLLDLGGGTPDFPTGQDQTVGKGINNLGDVAGAQGSSVASAFFYTGNLLLNMDKLVPTDAGWRIINATGVNDARQIIGDGFHGGFHHAYRYTFGGGIIDLGSIAPDTFSEALAINSAGQVVGDSNSHAFRYTDGAGMVDLGALSGDFYSSALGINAKSEVVGISVGRNVNGRAFLWTPSSGMQDLNAMIDPAAGWTLYKATGINDAGQIVGTGVHNDGHGNAALRAFRLTPVSPCEQQVQQLQQQIAALTDQNSQLQSQVNQLLGQTAQL